MPNHGARTCQQPECNGQVVSLYGRQGNPPKWVKAMTFCTRCTNIELTDEYAPTCTITPSGTFT